jgi:hypothetical protein
VHQAYVQGFIGVKKEMNTPEASVEHGVNPFDKLHASLTSFFFIGNILAIDEIDENQYIQDLQKE